MDKQYDLIVIGGGPAGMMAAGRAGAKGANVLLLEKNDRLGMKLAITGKGRCNITNAEFDISSLVKKYGRTGKFLFSAFNKFGPQDIIDFFNNRNLSTKIEKNNRVFPDNAKACDVIEVLKLYLKENSVDIMTNVEVKFINFNKSHIENIILKDDRELSAKEYLICTGGKSYPLTGSTGDAYKWLSEIGHKIISPQPALTSIILKEDWVKDLEGLSLKNIVVNVYQKNKKVLSKFGEALFTNDGLSGPIIIDMSKAIGELLQIGEVDIQIDFIPDLTEEELDQKIQNDFKEFSNKLYRNSLNSLLPQKLITAIVKLSVVDPEKKVNSITREERRRIVFLLKHFVLQVSKLSGFDKAVITTGGVDVKNIDPQTMRSKIIDNLFIAGELLDFDGPTGGYNLQICWSTGFVVGDNFI